MVDLDGIMEFAIPAILLLISIGFVWVKFGEPFVLPMIQRIWEWGKGKGDGDAGGDVEMKYE